jgi:two-component system, OmpR family, heavy metal sensor histidine kinase CusS
MRRRSIRVRLTVWYAAILSAALALFGGLIWLSMRHRLLAEIDAELAGRAARFENFFQAEAANGGYAQTVDELEEFCQALPPGSMLRLESAHFSFQYPHSPAPDMRTLQREFVFKDETFHLAAGAPVTDALHTLDLLRLLLWSLIPAVIAISSAGGWWLSGRALKPVQDITRIARDVGIENLAARVPVPRTGDEIAQLSEVLNVMLARLESAVRTLSQFAADASHELRTPLAVIRTSARAPGPSGCAQRVLRENARRGRSSRHQDSRGCRRGAGPDRR